MRLVRTLAAPAAVALVGVGLALAPTAHAAPVFTDANTALTPFDGASTADVDGGSSCAKTQVDGPTTKVPVVENGPSASASASVTAHYTKGGTPTDVGDGSASVSASGRVASVGGQLSSMDFTASGTAALTNSLPASGCRRSANAGVGLGFDFTLTQPGFLSVDMAGTGRNTNSLVYVFQYPGTGLQPNIDHSGSGVKFTGTDKVYLPAGEYRGFFEGESTVPAATQSVPSTAGSTTVHAEFHAAGSQTAAVSGKGKKYVVLAPARTCATHTLATAITSHKKRANKIKQVKFFVNDAQVKKVRTPDKNDLIQLPLADDQTADVRAEVKLFPTKKGRPGKVYEVSASYEACS